MDIDTVARLEVKMKKKVIIHRGRKKESCIRGDIVTDAYAGH